MPGVGCDENAHHNTQGLSATRSQPALQAAHAAGRQLSPFARLPTLRAALLIRMS
jgi:hypothetical protein